MFVAAAPRERVCVTLGVNNTVGKEGKNLRQGRTVIGAQRSSTKKTLHFVQSRLERKGSACMARRRVGLGNREVWVDVGANG